MNAPAAPVIEFWFEFGSNYSYLALMRIEDLARRAGVELAWKPFLLGPIFRELGWESSPFVLQKEKGEYVWRDMARRAKKYGLPFVRPTDFPRRALLPMRVALLGAGAPWMGEFCRRVMTRNWARDLEIASPESVLAALDGLVSDPPAIVRAAQEQGARAALRAQTEQARRLGIFGAPTFMVNGQMFWGDDRLEDALEAAQSL
jgi:2-hydroxychromene-2-carboxylate isomerase